MVKCSVCGKKIEYNKFKRYRGKIQCRDCYDKRLERKKAKKEAAEAKIKEDAKKVAAELEKAVKNLEPMDLTEEETAKLDRYNPYEQNQKEE